MSEEKYDLVVIGAGPGGYVGAIRAAQLGLRTAIIDKRDTLGGTCLNVGCIPSKALLESSHRYHDTLHNLGAHGIKAGSVELDLGVMMGRKRDVVEKLTRGIAGLMKKNRIDQIRGVAKIDGPGRVSISAVEDGPAPTATSIAADRILLATGSSAVQLPHIPFDGDRIVSSTEALSFDQTPETLLVVGGGAIGLELGSVWNRLGTKVTVVELTDQIVPGADRDAARALQRSLKKQGLDIRVKTSAASASVEGNKVHVDLEGPKGTARESFDRVLVAVGRRPYTSGVGLEEAGVALDDRGRVIVDDDFATNVAGIYALGDVTPGPMLAHKAEEEGVACAEKMAGKPGHVSYRAIPNIVYTWPELASVGMTETQVREAGHEIRTGASPFMANARARCMNEPDGLVKIIADAKTDALLGVHMVGAAVSELIAEAVVAVEFSSSAEDLARAVHAHPTLAECLREAALDLDDRAIRM